MKLIDAKLLKENNINDIHLTFGTFDDAKYVYNLMDDRDKHPISPNFSLIQAAEFYIIAKDKETPIGFIFGVSPDNIEIITFIGIDPKYRGYKLSTKLTNSYIIQCKKLGFKKILWWCDRSNKGSITLAQKFGGNISNKKELNSNPEAYIEFEIVI